MIAAKHGHNETVKTLIAAGADVNLKVGLVCLHIYYIDIATYTLINTIQCMLFT